MNVSKVDKVPAKSSVIKAILSRHLRVFNKNDLKPLEKEIIIDPNYLSQILSHLTREGFIEKIHKGLYVIAPIMDFSPVLEQEIAMKIVKPAMISHYTAFRYHELTEQIPGVIFVTTTKNTATPQKGTRNKKSGFHFHGVEYDIIQTTQDRFFGAMEVTGLEGSYKVTDLERTLLDGLARPELCGGFGEVMFALEESIEKIDLDKIIDYALRLDVAVGRRLGWALEKRGLNDSRLKQLSQKHSRGYRKLVSCNEARGNYDSTWRLQINT